MKTQYKILLSVFLVEVLIISVMKENGIKVQSLIGSAIGTFIFLLPIQVLLFLLSKDEKFSNNKRVCFNVIFWFINICYLLAIIGSLMLYLD